MRISTLIHVFGALATVAAAQTAAAPPQQPCAAIGPLIAKATSNVPQIPAEIAWQCLMSVPLNVTAAIEWIDSLRPYLAWQSTTSYLKNPQFNNPPHDILGELDRMSAQINSYANEWQFEFDLYRVFQASGDGHLRYLPTLVAGIFVFGRPTAVVSVSHDGHSLPRPYVYSDILQQASNPTFKPSPITLINGEDAVTYLKRLSQYASLQDADGQYNDVVYNLAQVSLGQNGNGPGMFAGGGRGGLLYPNATTEMTFENGTSRSYANFARVLRDFDGISNGQDIFDRYLIRYPNRTATTTPTMDPTNGIPLPVLAPGYPTPITGQANNYLRGFYLDGPGYENIAILTVGKFLGQDTDWQSFQRVAFDFINQSKAAGKTRLVVDLRANGGGGLLSGYDLFLNLFPDLFPYGANRLRAHEAFDIIGQTVSATAGPVYPWNKADPPGPGVALNTFLGTPFDYAEDVDVNYQNFGSWQQKYGPHAFNGDKFTSLIRWNLSDPNQEYLNGFTVNGFQDREGVVPAPPYLTENVVMLYDGYCASTCAIFTEFMTRQARVKTVVVGGQPSYAPMQTVGGTRGVNTWTFSTIYTFITQALSLGTLEQQAAWRMTELGQHTTLPNARSADNGGSLNVRDGIRQRDETQTPLQFAYYPADCRIFYEPGFTVDVTGLWKRVVDVTWGGATCVAGSTVGPQKRDGEIVKGTRHQRRAMAQTEFDALHAAVDGFTDFRHAKLTGNGEMLP